MNWRLFSLGFALSSSLIGLGIALGGKYLVYDLTRRR